MKYKAISQTKNFKLKLEKSTNHEPMIWFFTPKIMNDKPFCGTVQSSAFQLSLNSFMPAQKTVSIKGTFKKQNDNEFLIEFSVGISRFAKIWNVSVIIFAFILFNFVIFKNEGRIEWMPNIAILSIGLIALLMLYAIIDRAKMKFIEKLELIGVEKLK